MLPAPQFGLIRQMQGFCCTFVQFLGFNKSWMLWCIYVSHVFIDCDTPGCERRMSRAHVTEETADRCSWQHDENKGHDTPQPPTCHFSEPGQQPCICVCVCVSVWGRLLQATSPLKCAAPPVIPHLKRGKFKIILDGWIVNPLGQDWIPRLHCSNLILSSIVSIIRNNNLLLS